jgi:uncharacterized membrane protein
MQTTPIIAIHLTAAVAATMLGPIALWARRSGAAHPRLHRAAGYAWVTFMLVTALSAVFIQGDKGPRFAGFGLIHLLIPVTLAMLLLSFRHLLRGNITGHRKTMQRLYLGACVVAGAFTLLPDRLLGHYLWSSLGLV